MKEATARIKINKLLEKAGWRFFADEKGPANIQLEPSVKLKQQDLDDLGENFEKVGRGFIDFLLLDARGFPFIVLEAKAEDKNPLVGKEQARRYARSQNCRFVILSNGNLHYFWDLERGNPYIITTFPTPDSASSALRVVPDRNRIVTERVAEDYAICKEIDPAVELKFNKMYIGLSRGGVAFNFCTMVPRKSALNLTFRLPKDEAVDQELEAAGLDTLEYTRWGAYRLKLVPGDPHKHHDLLLKLLKASHDNRE